jgi:hypothetical protein
MTRPIAPNLAHQARGGAEAEDTNRTRALALHWERVAQTCATIQRRLASEAAHAPDETAAA